MDEDARQRDFEYAALRWDLTKLDDSVSFVSLVQAGETGCFAIIMVLEVGQNASPWLLKKGWMIFDEVVVSRSIVAGSGHGVPLAEAILHQLLFHNVRRACPPAGL
ncbi:unnamed protein product [Prorocentrum cordatum]|uniref:Uncharacterized protein n=1 Tax=Prorocentrum cordatum TaxID=2364126 RepID=A0ABN9U0K3_9DINO|nr:unnamed protein product [Polarella glacialis]